MVWWKKALIGSVAWIVLIAAVIGAHMALTQNEATTPEQDYAISRRYGQVFGFGIVFIWGLAFVTRKKNEGGRPPAV